MSAFPTSSHPHNRSPLAAPLLGADTTRLRVGFTRLRELRTGTDRETENGRRGLHVRGRSSARAAADRSPARTEGARPTLRRARTRLDPRDRCLSFGAARLSQEPLPEAGRVPPLALALALALGRRFSQPGSAPPRRRRTARFPLRIPRAEFPVPAAPPAPRCHWSVRRGGRAVGAGAFRAVVARCLRHHRARPGWPRPGWRRRCPAPCACCASTAPGRPRPGWGWRWRRAATWWTSAGPRCPAPCGPSWRAASAAWRLPAGGGPEVVNGGRRWASRSGGRCGGREVAVRGARGAFCGAEVKSENRTVQDRLREGTPLAHPEISGKDFLPHPITAGTDKDRP
ncbi:translation initiation factor IF-2-like isoform X10 [Gallus gallus]|uniref:translation initiation factor IF-2-like isoform X10 n=1 Tax=Gallus gallus TaxID=9031 RepID=UPI001EFFF6EA|nr:translation initiation factor IF-2-like isoform X10 [Gallus gallus]XP_046787685.1 translation initiation factor IF-2-like isoform X10 [Gallus gallus]XP_046787686.1 translation initiation factor IF-2-like isoform X10 [Gallus gallus]